MKFLVVADIHGEHENLTNILNNAPKDMDFIICPGDFTDMYNIPQGFSQLNIADIILQKLLAANKQVFCVPGNHDPYEILELFDEYNTNIHNKVKKYKGVELAGWGGAPTPFNTIFEPTEEETKESLARLGSKINNRFILVLHNPPKNTKLDLVAAGKHVGSQAARDFILDKKPVLVISAHIHEARGIDKLGDSVLFYPGEATKGYYGIVTIEGQDIKCELKKAKT